MCYLKIINNYNFNKFLFWCGKSSSFFQLLRLIYSGTLSARGLRTTRELHNVFTFPTLHIDGKATVISTQDKNLVTLAAKLGINIPAPCLKNGRRDGCCRACLVEVDGQRVYACGTAPKSNMQVTVRTRELDQIRRESLKQHNQKRRQNRH